MVVEKIDILESQSIFNLWEKKREWVESTDFYFSFSKLKQFAVSPLNFVEYMVGTSTKTDSMNFGQIDHVLILEGEAVFNSQFVVLDRPTDLRCNDSKNGFIGRLEHELLIKEAALINKKIVKKNDMEKALRIREMLMQDSVCREMLLDSEKEIAVEYELLHNDTFRRFKGRIDGAGQGFKFDLKNMANFTNKNLRSHILNEKLHIQAAIYQMSNVGHFDDDYFLLACDGNAVLPIQLSRDIIRQGVKDLRKILDKFELCTLEYRWFESVGFWHKGGVMVI